MSFAAWRRGFERLLEVIVVALLVVLTAIVIIGIVYREIGHPLPWYDEVASVLLAWLTYYGVGLGALKRAHISVPGLVRATPPRVRLVLAVLCEACVFAFFILLAFFGWKVLGVLAGETLVTVDIPVQLTQSAIPVGAILFLIAEAMCLPRVLSDAAAGREASEAIAIVEATE
ncbi:MAG: TRAP transporter small permease [Gammaproteobacteria bacterium]